MLCSQACNYAATFGNEQNVKGVVITRLTFYGEENWKDVDLPLSNANRSSQTKKKQLEDEQFNEDELYNVRKFIKQWIDN